MKGKNNMTPEEFSIAGHLELLLSSYKKWTGKELLIISSGGDEIVNECSNAPFALVSHDTGEDPVFNYGNRTALRLFELDWDNFTKLNSRKSTEPVNREERAELLRRVTENGFIDDYSGVRISSTGKRFKITDATVWNVVDNEGNHKGQAAFFDNWKYL